MRCDKHTNARIQRNLLLIARVLATTLVLSGCAKIGSFTNELKGDITGNTYDIQFYTNDGELFMSASGQKIDMESNIVKENTYSKDSGWGYTQTLSSVVTITIDGHQVESCGSTVLFAEKGLKKEVDFSAPENISSTADGITDNVFVARAVNEYKNAFGKPVVVIIQSQLGDPICAYSGDDVFWEVAEDLPKTTKLMIDGRALYIHRANFQIIDLALLDT